MFPTEAEIQRTAYDRWQRLVLRNEHAKARHASLALCRGRINSTIVPAGELGRSANDAAAP